VLGEVVFGFVQLQPRLLNARFCHLSPTSTDLPSVCPHALPSAQAPNAGNTSRLTSAVNGSSYRRGQGRPAALLRRACLTALAPQSSCPT
jgi:hypothetical protein